MPYVAVHYFVFTTDGRRLLLPVWELHSTQQPTLAMCTVLTIGYDDVLR